VRVITGRVVDGKIELATELGEGTPVAVIAADERGFRLSAEDEQELAEAVSAIRRGQFVDGRELLAELKSLKRP
jgi:hypothetical protein